MKRFEFKNTGRLRSIVSSKNNGYFRHIYDIGVVISIASVFISYAVLLTDSMSILKTLYNLYKASLHPLRVRSLEDYTVLGDSLIIKPVVSIIFVT